MKLRLPAAACLAVLLLAPAALARQTKPAGPRKIAPEKDSAAVALAAAQAARDRQDYATAVTLLENFLFDHPGHPEALLDLAYCYGLQGRTADAIDLYRQTLEANPKLFPARVNLGLLLLDSKQPEAAATEFERALELDPSHPRTHYYLGVALERNGESAAALEHYRRAAALDPALLEPRQAILDLLLEKKDIAGAEVALDELRRLQPDDPTLLRLRADLLLRQEKRVEALAAYEEYFEKKPDDAETHLRAGRLYQEEGKSEEALRHFRAAGADGLEEQADALLALERFAEAIPLYQEALAREPARADLHANLGFALLKTTHYPEAAAELAEAARLNPEKPGPYSHLAAALTLAGDLTGAIRALDERARYAEETPATLFLRAWNYDKLAQCGRAIAYYEKFLAMNRDTQSDQYFQATGRLRLLKNVCRENRH